MDKEVGRRHACDEDPQPVFSNQTKPDASAPPGPRRLSPAALSVVAAHPLGSWRSRAPAWVVAARCATGRAWWLVGYRWKVGDKGRLKAYTHNPARRTTSSEVAVLMANAKKASVQTYGTPLAAGNGKSVSDVCRIYLLQAGMPTRLCTWAPSQQVACRTPHDGDHNSAV